MGRDSYIRCENCWWWERDNAIEGWCHYNPKEILKTASSFCRQFRPAKEPPKDD